MKIVLEKGTIIGGVNCIFLQKSWHIYRARTEILGYAIRRKGWMELESLDSFKANELKKKIFIAYLKDVRTPLYKHKQKDIADLQQRAD